MVIHTETATIQTTASFTVTCSTIRVRVAEWTDVGKAADSAHTQPRSAIGIGGARKVGALVHIVVGKLKLSVSTHTTGQTTRLKAFEDLACREVTSRMCVTWNDRCRFRVWKSRSSFNVARRSGRSRRCHHHEEKNGSRRPEHRHFRYAVAQEVCC